MNGILRSSDPWSTAVIALTLALFLLALFLKGFTHDLLLEAAVFLVSVKLILMAYKNRLATERADAQLHAIELLLRRLERRLDQPKTAAETPPTQPAPDLPGTTEMDPGADV